MKKLSIIAALAIAALVSSCSATTTETAELQPTTETVQPTLYERLDGVTLTNANIIGWTKYTCAECPELNEYSLTISVPELNAYDVVIPVSMATYKNVNKHIGKGEMITMTLKHRAKYDDFVYTEIAVNSNNL